jgi:hypothetical protein
MMVNHACHHGSRYFASRHLRRRTYVLHAFNNEPNKADAYHTQDKEGVYEGLFIYITRLEVAIYSGWDLSR